MDLELLLPSNFIHIKVSHPLLRYLACLSEFRSILSCCRDGSIDTMTKLASSTKPESGCCNKLSTRRIQSESGSPQIFMMGSCKIWSVCLTRLGWPRRPGRQAFQAQVSAISLRLSTMGQRPYWPLLATSER